MIVIRADANREIGTGHVMRCLSIAAALKKLGHQVCFLTADQGAVPLLLAKGQAYRVLDSDYRDLEGELAILERLFSEQRPKGCFTGPGEYFRESEPCRESLFPQGDSGCGKNGSSLDFFLADSYFVTAEYFRKVREWMPVGCLDDKCLSGFPLGFWVNYKIFAGTFL